MGREELCLCREQLRPAKLTCGHSWEKEAISLDVALEGILMCKSKTQPCTHELLRSRLEWCTEDLSAVPGSEQSLAQAHLHILLSLLTTSNSLKVTVSPNKK